MKKETEVEAAEAKDVKVENDKKLLKIINDSKFEF